MNTKHRAITLAAAILLAAPGDAAAQAGNAPAAPGIDRLAIDGILAADGASRGHFAVWAVGLPDGYVMMEHQAPVIHVTADDVAHGVVQVRGGSRLVITTHGPSSYAVDFRTRSALFQAVQIDGIGRPVEFGPTGGTVVQQEAAAGRRVIVLDYRFSLAPGAIPGTYAWPLDVVVRGVRAIHSPAPRRKSRRCRAVAA